MIDPSAFTIPYDRHLCSTLGHAGHDIILFTRALRQHDYFKSADNPPSELADPTFVTDELFYRSSKRTHAIPRNRRFQLLAKAIEHVRNMRKLRVRLQEFQPTSIHFQWLVIPAIDVYFVKRLRRLAPVFLTVHDAEAYHSPSSKFQLLGWASALANFDGLIVHTKHTRNRLEAMGIPPSRIKEVPHGLLCHSESTSTKVADPRTNQEGICRLLFFGSIKEYKGLDVLIRALALIPQEVRQKLRLRVAGNPDLPEREIRQLAVNCGVDQLIDWQLHFFQDDEIDKLFHECDVVVFPYRRIDASGALMTALPFRKAIIASHVGQFGELLQNRRSAMLVRPDDPSALATAIAEFLSDPQLRLLIASGIDEVVRSIPSWNDIAENTADFYRRFMPIGSNEFQGTA